LELLWSGDDPSLHRRPARLAPELALHPFYFKRPPLLFIIPFFLRRACFIRLVPLPRRGGSFFCSGLARRLPSRHSLPRPLPPFHWNAYTLFLVPLQVPSLAGTHRPVRGAIPVLPETSRFRRWAPPPDAYPGFFRRARHSLLHKASPAATFFLFSRSAGSGPSSSQPDAPARPAPS